MKQYRTMPPPEIPDGYEPPSAAPITEPPTLVDLVVELRETLGLFAGAMPITPKAAWDEAIGVVVSMRRSAREGTCWVCAERSLWGEQTVGP